METPSTHVVILGAGFSKAVSSRVDQDEAERDQFPLLPELAERVLPLIDKTGAPSTGPLLEELRSGVEQMRKRSGPEPGFDFESWLTRLALDQPHLGTAENLERRALFGRVAAAIREVLVEVTESVFTDGTVSAAWPYHLMSVLDLRSATLITTNYDIVVERLVGKSVLFGANSAECAPPEVSDLFSGLPQTDPIPTSRGRTVAMHLLKLHGSLDWYQTPGDPTGTTLLRWAPQGGDGEADPERQDHPPGREPFLVPPSAEKSRYLLNPVVHELWTRARSALDGATKVSIVGYSLPATDITFRGLLADTLRRPGVEVEVVDRFPEQVVQQLGALGVEAESAAGGEGAVSDWVDKLVQEEAGSACERLKKLGEKLRAGGSLFGITQWSEEVYVEGSPHGQPIARIVSGCQRNEDEGTWVLQLKPNRTGDWTGLRRCQLEEACPPPEATAVVAALDGIEHPVIGCRHTEEQVDAGPGELKLLLACAPGEMSA